MSEIQSWNIPYPLSGGTVDTGEEDKQHNDKHFTRKPMKNMAAIFIIKIMNGVYWQPLKSISDS